MITVKSRVTKEEILRRTDEYSIYQYYWGKKFELNHAVYSSPFREDSQPSFGVYVTKGGHLRHHDYGKSEYSGNCFAFVMQILGCDFSTALDRVDHDLNLGINKGTKPSAHQVTPIMITPKERAIIQIIPRAFTKEELAYWNQYGIDISDLKKHGVYSIAKLLINKKTIPSTELKFAYHFKDEYRDYLKIYTPHAKDKKNKFITNVPGNYLAGKDTLQHTSNLALVTKSMKDHLVLSKVHSEVVSVQSESITALSDDSIKFLQESYDRTVINFDPDQTGVETCTHYNQFGFGYVNLSKEHLASGIKDFADMAKYSGVDAVHYYLKHKNVL